MMSAHPDRYKSLSRLTQNEAIIEELLAYTQHAFGVSNFEEPVSFPLVDEPHVATWEMYLDRSAEKGVFETLKDYLVQFQFPIQEGISQTPAYKAATLKGDPPADMEAASGLLLNEPESLELFIYQSPAGKVPVLIIPDSQDFQRVTQALAYRNEPRHVPPAMGASLIKGLNNWDRIRRLKTAWLASHPMGNWSMYMRQSIIPNRSLYQDKLILLSQKPYSGVSAENVGLDTKRWKKDSVGIRLEHECTHLFTLRYFGAMANNMHDELIADYMGISKVTGYFRPDWFLHFIGLENYPVYRKGARLENYLGNPVLSSAATKILERILVEAVQQVAVFDQELGPTQSTRERTLRLLTLCQFSLEQIADEEGAERLIASYRQAKTMRILS